MIAVNHDGWISPVGWELYFLDFLKTILITESSFHCSKAGNPLLGIPARVLLTASSYKGDTMTSKHQNYKTLALTCLSLVLIGCGTEGPMEDSQSIGNPAYSSRSTSSPLAEMDMPMMAMEMAGNMAPDMGTGPGMSGNRYDRIEENQYKRVTDAPFSTFSIDVDTASYRNIRQFLLEYNQMPRPDAVRTEELVNYFLYQYQPPAFNHDVPFSVNVDSADCPWNREHQLVRVALKGKQIEFDERPNMNLVLLLDTSGSMEQPNKLPLLKQAMRLLLNQLDESDRIAIIAYAGTPGLVLDSTTADQHDKIMNALNRLEAGGSTNGGGGIELAYEIAREHFIEGGTNRVILGTDGDFNVGMTGTDQLIDLVKTQASEGVDLTVLGFGMGNYNDAMLEQISGKGNGNYAFIDTYSEAKKVLLEQLSSTLITIAKDVKIQIEFNPTHVDSYRLIGYENRVLETEDFNNDKKDAGEIGAGHAVTALYEIVPAGTENANVPAVDSLKYQTPRQSIGAENRNELMTVKLRYKAPGNDQSQKIEIAVEAGRKPFPETDSEFKFAAAVANFGMQLRQSQYRGDWTYSDIEAIARQSKGEDRHGFREEFLQMVSVAKSLTTSEVDPTPYLESTPQPGYTHGLRPLIQPR